MRCNWRWTSLPCSGDAAPTWTPSPGLMCTRIVVTWVLRRCGSERHPNPPPNPSGTCDSVVRAPIAPQATQSAMNCGEIVSRNSTAAGTPCSLTSQSSWRPTRRPLLMEKEPFRSGSLINPCTEATLHHRLSGRLGQSDLPADVGARLLEVNAHDDDKVLRVFCHGGLQPLAVFHLHTIRPIHTPRHFETAVRVNGCTSKV